MTTQGPQKPNGGHGSFTPDLMRKIRANSGLQLHGVLAAEQSANVGVCVHPRVPVMLTAFYGLESRLDLWNLDTGKHVQALQIRGEGNAEATGVMILGPNGPISGSALPIRDLALSPSGHLVALACGKQVRLVAVEQTGGSMEELIELAPQNAGVHAVAFSHSGEMLASASDDGQLVIWNVAAYHTLSTFHLPEARLRSVSFSSDDLLVATGDTDGNVAVWDVVTGHQMAYFQAHKGEVRCVRFGPHGYLLATCGVDGLIRLWDMAEAKPFGRPMAHGDSVYSLAMHRGGGLLYSCSFDGRIGVWRLDNQRLVDAYEDDAAVLAIAPYPDDGRLVSVTSSAVKVLTFRHDPRSVPPPENFALAAATGAALPELGQVAASQDEAIISDVDEDYLRARRGDSLSDIWSADTPGYRPAPPQPQAPAYPQPQAPPVAPLADMATLPAQPPVGQPPSPFGAAAPPPRPREPRRVDSSPLVPARENQEQAEQVSADMALQRKRQELKARRQRKRLVIALLFCLTLGFMGAVVGYGTTPSPQDDPALEQRRAPIVATYDQQVEAAGDKHRASVAQLQERLDRARKNAPSAELRALVDELEAGIQQEKQRHRGELERLAQARDQQLASLVVEDPTAGLVRAAIGGAVTFFVGLLLSLGGLLALGAVRD